MLQLVESVENKVPKKIVSFSVRFDAGLFDRLERYINSIPRDRRPTKYGFIQSAVERAIAENTADDSASLKPQVSNDRYTENTSKQKGEEACYQQLGAILRLKNGAATEAVSAMLAAFVAIMESGADGRSTDVPTEVQGAISSAQSSIRDASTLVREADRACEVLGKIADGDAEAAK